MFRAPVAEEPTGQMEKDEPEEGSKLGKHGLLRREAGNVNTGQDGVSGRGRGDSEIQMEYTDLRLGQCPAGLRRWAQACE